uniref:Ig-like domain-containing protein n=1 Tax=Sinocyclocheilus anshuiensis TaxID=1608454 RepID=A0A671QRP2_9TELE
QLILKPICQNDSLWNVALYDVIVWISTASAEEDQRLKEDLSDMVYTVKLVFNQKLLCSYDSRLEKYVGSDELGIRNAEHYNNQSWKMKQRKEELETICRANARLYIKSETRKGKQPQLHTYYLSLLSRSTKLEMKLTTLECHAYNFYPQAINVTWLLDGSEVTGDVVSTEFMDNGDWSYQMHSYLELVLHRGVPVSCRVEHSGLKEPLVTLWAYNMHNYMNINSIKILLKFCPRFIKCGLVQNTTNN